MKKLSIKGTEYSSYSDETVILVNYLMKVWEKAGKPDDISSDSSWKVVDTIFQVWKSHYKQELDDWLKEMKEEQSVERTPHEALKANGGYFPIVFPTRLFRLLTIMFPLVDLKNMNLVKKIAQRYPYLKATKYAI